MNREALRRNARDAIARLAQNGALPVLPAVAAAARAIAAQPDPEIGKLCQVIQSDGGLAARVLRVANSLGLGRLSKARTVHDAVVTTGVNTASEILIAACVRELYGGWGIHGGTLWSHALMTALATEHLARKTGLAEPSEAFLPGLFHDVGRLVFLIIDPPAFETIERLAPAESSVRIGLERLWYGFDHALAGSILVEDWGLSREQCEGIGWHHDVEQADGGRKLALLISGADAIAYHLGFATRCECPAPSHLEELGLTGDKLNECAREVLEAFELHKNAIG